MEEVMCHFENIFVFRFRFVIQHVRLSFLTTILTKIKKFIFGNKISESIFHEQSPKREAKQHPI